MNQNKKIRKIKRLEGNTIFLRHLKKTDATANYVKWLNSKKINQFLESRFIRHNKKDVENYIKKMNKNPNIIFLAIIRRDNNKHIGNIKLGPIDWNHRFGEIGIMIGDKNSCGKGYGTDAIKLLSDFGFDYLKLHKIGAGVYENNIGSIKAFLKVGFFIDGIRYKQYLNKGVYEDHVLVGKINELR